MARATRMAIRMRIPNVSPTANPAEKLKNSSYTDLIGMHCDSFFNNFRQKQELLWVYTTVEAVKSLAPSNMEKYRTKNLS